MRPSKEQHSNIMGVDALDSQIYSDIIASRYGRMTTSLGSVSLTDPKEDDGAFAHAHIPRFHDSSPGQLVWWELNERQSRVVVLI